MHAAPTLSIDILVPVANIVWPQISVAYFSKLFESIFTVLVVGGGCILSISSCWPLHTYHLQCNFCMRATRGGAFASPASFKTLDTNFDMCRNFQRIEMKFYILIMFEKSY